MFDFNVMLETSVEGGGPPHLTEDFVVSGVLGQEEGPGEPQAPKKRDLKVLVSVWQTWADAEDGGSPTEIFARALGFGGQLDDQLGKWSARLAMRDVMRDERKFRLGRPATGAALIVENTGDPTAFETYAWTGRLWIGDDTRLKANP
jgi:hypothetical protein